MLLLLNCRLALLCQLPHGVDEGQVLLVAASLNPDRRGLSPPDRRGLASRCRGLLSRQLILHNNTLGRLDPIIIGLEVLRLLHIRW